MIKIKPIDKGYFKCNFYVLDEVQERVTKVMTSHYNALGHMTLHEWSVVVCFSALIMLWFFRD